MDRENSWGEEGPLKGELIVSSLRWKPGNHFCASVLCLVLNAMP